MNYNTINTLGKSLFKEKGSKHFGYAFPVSTEAQIKEYIGSLQEQHNKANHVCYAYKLGTSGNTYRINDDGEPSGSAGKPIMGQLESFEVTNILVAVVRYFGGTKLGVSGLQKAYKTAAKEAILATEIITKEIEMSLRIAFPFEKQGEIDYLINSQTGKIVEKNFTDGVTYTLHLPKKNIEAFEQRISAWHEVIYELGEVL